ncbi:hypothetical protein, partial [Breoghania sp.]|uniref:hypothetical protein n=1 Tax=Breoghania sp. TaxID=2065378 RepID=UPI0026099C71
LAVLPAAPASAGFKGITTAAETAEVGVSTSYSATYSDYNSSASYTLETSGLDGLTVTFSDCTLSISGTPTTEGSSFDNAVALVYYNDDGD